MGHCNSCVWFLTEQSFASTWKYGMGRYCRQEIILNRSPSPSVCPSALVVLVSAFLPVLSRNSAIAQRNRCRAPVFTNQIEIVSSLFLLNCFISHQTSRSVLSHNSKAVATILQRGTRLGCRRAGYCCIPCMPSVFTSPSVIWG